ncbi:MAG: adenine deaminase [Clostridiaceae bacterium]|nr:adenine deaminase [Clostridiaceae bacterium]
MKDSFWKHPHHASTRRLTAVALGREPADLVLRKGRLVNVCTGEILDGTDIAVADGRIALVGDATRSIGPATRVIEARGRLMVPGLLDGHVHVESSMMTLARYAEAVIPHGTAGIFMDPHEIANVLGMDGVRWMCEDGANTALKAFLTVPSCVPAMEGFEDAGAAITLAQVAEAMDWPSCVGLGEMMDFPGVLTGDVRAHAMLAATLSRGGIPTGHFPLEGEAASLAAYVAAGPRCCHESTRAEDALQKMRMGMYAMLREGSAWHDLAEVAGALTKHTVDSRFAMLVTDDAHPHTLTNQGHMDHLLRRAVQEGIDPVTALQMVTINCAQCFRLDHEIGSLTPGKCADIVLMEDLDTFAVSLVVLDGVCVYEDGKLRRQPVPYVYPARAMDTMRLAHDPIPGDFSIPAHAVDTDAPILVIRVRAGKVGTEAVRLPVPIRGGCYVADPGQDILKAAVLERHSASGSIGLGFVSGFGIRKGAMASTVAHDAHNLMVVGADDTDMALAARLLQKAGGGMAVVADGTVLGLVELPVAGLMGIADAPEMAKQVAQLEEAWKTIGCTMPSPFMTMALLSLSCLPELRLTNRGLVDTVAFRFTNLAGG